METIPAIKACAVCTQEFTYPPNNPRALYCSDACREQGRPSRVSICACGNKKWRYSETCRVCMNSARYARTRDVALQTREQRISNKMARLLLEKSSRQGSNSRTFKAAICRVCGTAFVTLNVGITCSGGCQRQHEASMKREHEHRRRARQKAAFVSPVYRLTVYTRDSWMCQLCGLAIDRQAVSPHPLSASIDHVIPLSKGGTHEPSNVQASHLLCNALKGDRVAS